MYDLVVLRLMGKMTHHPKNPRRGSQRHICGKEVRTRPPAPPDFNVGDEKILVWGGATILSIRGKTPVPPTLKSGGRGGGAALLKTKHTTPCAARSTGASFCPSTVSYEKKESRLFRLPSERTKRCKVGPSSSPPPTTHNGR